MRPNYPSYPTILPHHHRVANANPPLPLQFPYALSALPDTLEAKWDSPDFVSYRGAFPEEHRASPAALHAHVADLMSRDVKIAYLKSLQGYLWADGYATGRLKAPLFADVPPKFTEWKARGLEIMIYSSGSVPAQKLLFRHTDAGPGQPASDLTPLITDYFDTVNAGPKQEAASYRKIAAAHEMFPAGAWLFLSDNVREVEAAKAAGMQSVVVQRSGNADLPEGTAERHRVVRSLDDLGVLGA